MLVETHKPARFDFNETHQILLKRTLSLLPNGDFTTTIIGTDHLIKFRIKIRVYCFRNPLPDTARVASVE